MYKVYINGTLLNDEPGDLMDFMEVMERDDSIRCLLLKFPLKLTFWGDGYKILYNAYRNNGFCGTQSLIIEQKVNNSDAYTQIFKGLIFLTSAIFNLNENSVECRIEDDGFYSKIFNNKSIKAKLDVSKSKNGVAITPAASIQIAPFHPQTGLYEETTIRAFDIKEVIRYLIDFMSDQTIGFESNFLDNLPNEERICVCRGVDIRSTGQLAPMISFKEAFEEIDKKYNVSFVIKRVGGVPILQMEQDASFYESDYIVTIDNIDGLEMSFNEERLYSKVKIGSSIVVDYNPAADPQPHALPPIQFLGFQDEEYTVQGECNIDKELNLISNWVIDTNVIQEVLEGEVTTYDDNIFLIQYTEATLQATAKNYLTGGIPYLYNEQLLNKLVAPRWEVQGDIVVYLSDLDPAFHAVATNDTIITTDGTYYDNPNDFPIFRYDDDYINGNDSNNNYGNGMAQGDAVTQGNSVFIAVEKGLHTFEVYQPAIELTRVSADDLFDVPPSYTFNARRTDSDNLALEFRTTDDYEYVYPEEGSPYEQYLPIPLVYNPDPGQNVTYTYPQNFLFSFYLNIGDKVYIEGLLHPAEAEDFDIDLSARFIAGGYFRCISSSTAGGTAQPSSPTTYRVPRFTFTSGLSLENWNLIKNNPAGAIRFNHDGVTQRIGWVRKVSRNIETSEADFELISNIANGN